MNYTKIHLNDLTIVGLSVRTTNQDSKAMSDIGNLFHQFYSQNIVDKIQGKLSNDVYCVYTDYESDYMGEYTVYLGCSVSSTKKQADLDIKHIPTSNYRKYTAVGNINTAVGKTWNEIWADTSIPRKYEADFDVYGAEALDLENATIYTYLSIS